jgi:hypothetical protein
MRTAEPAPSRLRRFTFSRALSSCLRVLPICIALCSGGCVGLTPSVEFQLGDLGRPAMLSRVDRIGEDPVAADRPARRATADQTCRSQLILAAGGVYVAVATHMDIDASDPSRPARALSSLSSPSEPADFRIGRIDVRYVSQFPLFLREVNEFKIDCDAVEVEKVGNANP